MKRKFSIDFTILNNNDKITIYKVTTVCQYIMYWSSFLYMILDIDINKVLLI